MTPQLVLRTERARFLQPRESRPRRLETRAREEPHLLSRPPYHMPSRGKIGPFPLRTEIHPFWPAVVLVFSLTLASLYAMGMALSSLYLAYGREDRAIPIAYRDARVREKTRTTAGQKG